MDPFELRERVSCLTTETKDDRLKTEDKVATVFWLDVVKIDPELVHVKIMTRNHQAGLIRLSPTHWVDFISALQVGAKTLGDITVNVEYKEKHDKS